MTGTVTGDHFEMVSSARTGDRVDRQRIRAGSREHAGRRRRRDDPGDRGRHQRRRWGRVIRKNHRDIFRLIAFGQRDAGRAEVVHHDGGFVDEHVHGVGERNAAAKRRGRDLERQHRVRGDVRGGEARRGRVGIRQGDVGDSPDLRPAVALQRMPGGLQRHRAARAHPVGAAGIDARADGRCLDNVDDRLAGIHVAGAGGLELEDVLVHRAERRRREDCRQVRIVANHDRIREGRARSGR